MIACQEQTPSSRGVRRGSGAHGQQKSDGTLTAWDVFILHLYCWFNRKERKKKCAFLIQIENYFDKNTKMTLILFFFFPSSMTWFSDLAASLALLEHFVKWQKKHVFFYIYSFLKKQENKELVLGGQRLTAVRRERQAIEVFYCSNLTGGQRRKTFSRVMKYSSYFNM